MSSNIQRPYWALASKQNQISEKRLKELNNFLRHRKKKKQAQQVKVWAKTTEQVETTAFFFALWTFEMPLICMNCNISTS